MPTATLTSKGQITVPKEVRERLRVKSGDVLEFEISGDGRILVKPAQGHLRALKGLLRQVRKRPVSLEAMERAIQRRGRP